MKEPTKEEQLSKFFQAVVTNKEAGGYLLIAAGDGTGNWWQEFFDFKTELNNAIKYIFDKAPEYNVYFSAHLFRSHDSHKNNAMPTRTIQADLDDAELELVTLPPNIVVETSPGRHQAYWLLNQQIDNDVLENYSRNLTYSIPLCDRSGWTIGHRVRVPFTFNYKRPPEAPEIIIVRANPNFITVEQLEQIPKVNSLSLEHYDKEWLDKVHEINPGVKPLELLESVKAKLPPTIYAMYNHLQDDRSAYLWALTCAAFRAGLPRDHVFWLAKNTVNNKFASLRYNAEYELGKDILRAQEAVKSHITDIKTAIVTIRKQRGSPLEKRQLITKIVIDRMRNEGIFLHADNGTLWYIRRDQGRPVQIARVSEYLRMLLAIEFGLNAIESEQHYIVNELEAYTLNLPEDGFMCTLSHYDVKNPDDLFLHTGKQSVLRIRKDAIEEVPQGFNNLVFPWGLGVESYIPKYEDDFDWSTFLFEQSLTTIVDMPKTYAHAMLKVWMLFIVLRNAAVARPILAFIGQQGAGKSTLFRKLYCVIYGRRRALSGITNKDDFDHAVSTDSLVVLDNLDTLESWLPDRLALIAASSDITRRKLYTDVDTVVIRRQAILGVSSHNPQFGREDVADRMIILNFKRLTDDERVSESLILDEIDKNRGRIWGGIIKDLQRILANPIPAKYPSFRIEDFARVGMWIAQGVGIEHEFEEAISFVREAQSRLVLDEDGLLVDALLRYVVKQNGNLPEWESPATLWTKLSSLSPDPGGFARKYRSAGSFSRKLVAFSEPLKKVLDIRQEYNVARGTRLWQIAKKGLLDNHDG